MSTTSNCRMLAAKSAATCTLLTLLIGLPGQVPAKPPTMAEIKAIVEKHLHSQAGYLPGDLISRKDVEPIFDDLLELGAPLAAGQEDLYDDFVPESSHLVRTLRTPSGRAFMQKVKSIPGIYDRLERLAWNPKGRELIEMLVDDPQGPAILKVMLEPAGMAATAKYLGDDPSGKNFSIPTGHVHTANELLKRLDKVLASRKAK